MSSSFSILIQSLAGGTKCLPLARALCLHLDDLREVRYKAAINNSRTRAAGFEQVNKHKFLHIFFYLPRSLGENRRSLWGIYIRAQMEHVMTRRTGRGICLHLFALNCSFWWTQFGSRHVGPLVWILRSKLSGLIGRPSS